MCNPRAMLRANMKSSIKISIWSRKSSHGNLVNSYGVFQFFLCTMALTQQLQQYQVAMIVVVFLA